MADLNAQAKLRQDSLAALERVETRVARELPDASIEGADQLMVSLQTSAQVSIAIGLLTLADEVAALRAAVEKEKDHG